MLNHFFSSRFAGVTASLLLATSVALLAGCGGGGGSAPSTTPPGSGPGTGTTVTAVVSSLSLGTSAISIKTDNSTSATLTATPIDASNAAMADVTVSFATTSGVLSDSTKKSGLNGVASVTLSSGSIDSSNRTATVTVTAGGKTASIPVLINGSTLTLTPSAGGSVQVGAGKITISATAKDAGGAGKNGQTVRFSIGATSTGAATLSATTLVTDVTGTTSDVTFTPTAPGTVVVVGEWLDAKQQVSVTASQAIAVTPAAGIAFAITTPAINPLPIVLSGTQPLSVTVPATIDGQAVASVRISATAGTWTGVTQATAPGSSIIQTPVNSGVAATFTAPTTSGSVTVQVDALNAKNGVLSTLPAKFAVSADPSAAAAISLQTSVAVIGPSSGTNASTATLTTTVRDAKNNTVANAPVLFELLGTTGSGESISPAVAYTNDSGQATATFTAGSAPTVGAVYARASVLGVDLHVPCTGSPATTLLCSVTPLTVASSAVSVVVAFGTTISDTANHTQYQYPGSVLVVDANGSAVAGATVTLSVFPIRYNNGTLSGPGSCVFTSNPLGWVDNEDVNRNGILDANLNEDVNGNGVISPPQAAGGTVPTTVTTDSFGAATFILQYSKKSAFFIEDEVTARVIVSGTERSARTTFILGASIEDAYSLACPIGGTASY